MELLNVSILLQAFWQILLLRKSPETIPYSQFLLGVILVLHLLMGFGGALITLSVGLALGYAALGTALLVAYAYLLLMLYGMGNRWVQTATVLAGSEIFISLLALPLSVWLTSVDKADMALPALLSLLLLGWLVAVVAHIWRYALGVPKWLGFLFSVAYVIISISVTSLIQAPEG